MTVEELHAQACKMGLSTYQDPATGYSVFTALALEKAGSCCGSGCRHCPYGHVRVPDAIRLRIEARETYGRET